MKGNIEIHGFTAVVLTHLFKILREYIVSLRENLAKFWGLQLATSDK